MTELAGETAVQLPTAPAAVLTDEQRDFLAECEAEFAHRFSEEDPEFVRQRRDGTPEPPVMVPWFSRRPWQDRGGRGGGGGWRRGRFNSPYDRDRSGGRDFGGDRQGGRDIRDDRQGGRDFRDDRQGGRDFRDDRQGGRDYRDDRRGGGDYRDDRQGDRDRSRDDRPGGSGHYGGDRRQYDSGQ